MPRAEITRDGVLNAIAEFETLGRAAFLDRYGFNGARDYFLLHKGKRYDSKPIAAVAHRWAPDGDGRALTALELSGGRADAARRLRDLGFTVTDPRDASADDQVATAVPNFQNAYARFLKNVAAKQKGEPFASFNEGVVAAWEGYKPRLRARALEILGTEGWYGAMIGTGEILRRTISAIEIHEDRINLTNNLVFWQNRYGHANRDHRALLEAVDRPATRRLLEQAIFDLYQGGDEEKVFARLSELLGARYPLLAYLFFLKDMNRFLPIQPTGFDQAFRELGIGLVTLRKCDWDNYLEFNRAVGTVQSELAHVPTLEPVSLIDAHSFCWMLVKLPDAGAPDTGGIDPGRVLGARAKAIVNMRFSIEHTVGQANGQFVQRILRNKELMLDTRALDKLLERLLDLQDNRCALTGIPFRFDGADRALLPSPDRIDSLGHYAEGNIQIVSQFVNFWKSKTPDDEFRRLLDLVRQVAP